MQERDCRVVCLNPSSHSVLSTFVYINPIKRLTASILGLAQAATKFFESQTASKVGEETGITWA